jgi:hypothetical protein
MLAPSIQSIGPPPTRHAERVVDEMLVFLHRQHGVFFEKARRVIDPRQMGTPVGLRRTSSRLMDSLGVLALAVYVQEAKRGKGSVSFADWTVWDVEAGKEAGEAMPLNACLAAFMNTYRCVHHRPQIVSTAPLLVSRHACVRLAQRADVRTVSDLILVMRDLWAKTFALITGPEKSWLEPHDGHWRIPLAQGQIAILTPCHDGARRLVVKTILDRNMT